MCKKIMLAGASGTGKTTLCKKVELENTGYPFISGSVSDLLPETKDIPHQEMLSRDSKALVMEDYQILNLRNKLYSSVDGNFISDRSYLDLAAYFIYKQSNKLPQCEVEQFINLCKMCLNQQCTHLIFVPFTKTMFNEWVTEDNGKRITSKFFQMHISSIMDMVLSIWGYEKTADYDRIPKKNTLGILNRDLEEGWEEGIIKSPYGNTQVIILKEVNLQNRIDIVNTWLKRN